MAVLYIRNVPDALHRRTQAAAAARGTTLSAHVIALMEADVARAQAKARGLATLTKIRRNLTRRQRSATGAQPSTADLVRAGRAERERVLLHG
jgi:plasmid stability protein